jgi:hypothetical protein
VGDRISVISNSLTSPDTVSVTGIGTTLFPVMAFSVSTVNFGSVKVGQYKDTTITITNNGTDTLRIVNLTTSNSVFTGRPTIKNVSPSQAIVDTLKFTPTSAGVFTGRVFVYSNALKNPDTIIVSGTGITPSNVDNTSIVPGTFVLEQNYPNPFNPSTMILYSIQARSMVRLEVFNLLGQRIEVLVNSNLEPGIYRATWNAAVPSGMYFYKMEAVPLENPGESFRQVRKMTLMK